MHERVKQEIAILKRNFPDLQHGDQLDWVLISKYQLPDGRFNRDFGQILWKIPIGYPQIGPDDFFTDSDLRLNDASMPPSFNIGSNSSAGPAPIPGNWGWFSWHPETWRPSSTIEGGDNLVSFLRSVNRCLKGE
jgi:hypothetical protein